MGVRLVVAMAKNRVIGADNKMLWHLPGDFAYFKKATMGKSIVMGRKTFESIGRPLPGRTNIVVTHSSNWTADGVTVVNSVPSAIHTAKAQNMNDIMVIGGGRIYAQTIDIAEALLVTEVDITVDGDTLFPYIDNTVWHKDSVSADMTENCITYRFVVYKKQG